MSSPWYRVLKGRHGPIFDPETPLPTRKKPCKRCGGTGWISVPDPILGGLIDTRCPACSP